MDNYEYIQQRIRGNEKATIRFFRFFYGFGIVQGMKNVDIKELQLALEAMRKYEDCQRLIYVILLGITNHWSILIIVSENKEIKFYYLDSLNINRHNFLTNEDIMEFAHERVIHYFNPIRSRTGKNFQ